MSQKIGFRSKPEKYQVKVFGKKIKDKNMKIFPIINLNLENSPYTQADISQLYKKLISGIDDWTCREDHIDYVNTVEFSLNNPCLFENLFDIKMDLLMGNLDLAFGSLISIDQVLSLTQALPKIIPNQYEKPFKVFAPCYDPEVFKLLCRNEVTAKFTEYIPGVSCEEDIEEISYAIADLDLLKIFPLSAKDPQSFLKLLQGPYPELRSERFSKRIIAPSKEMAEKYDIFNNYKKNEDVILISSPRQYQKIRKEFMLNQSMKILLKPQEMNVQELIQIAKEYFPRADIVVAGIGPDLETVKKLKRVSYVATKMFKSTILDILSGAIDSEEAGKLIANELNQYSLIST